MPEPIELAECGNFHEWEVSALKTQPSGVMLTLIERQFADREEDRTLLRTVHIIATAPHQLTFNGRPRRPEQTPPADLPQWTVIDLALTQHESAAVLTIYVEALDLTTSSARLETTAAALHAAVSVHVDAERQWSR